MLLVSLENNKRLDEESVKTEQNLDKEIAKLIDQFLEGRSLNFLIHADPLPKCASARILVTHSAVVGQREEF